MSKFRKQAKELETHFDRWMYLLKNLNKFREITDFLQEKIFRKVFELAEVANLKEEEMNLYESSLKDKRDWKNAIDTAIEKGMVKGMKEGLKKGWKRAKNKIKLKSPSR